MAERNVGGTLKYRHKNTLRSGANLGINTGKFSESRLGRFSPRKEPLLHVDTGTG
jgi:hypothetical protein